MLTLTPNAGAIRGTGSIAVRQQFCAEDVVIHSWLVDHEWQTGYGLALLAIAVFSFIPNTYPANRLACIPLVCPHVAHPPVIVAGVTQNPLGAESLRALCNKALLHTFVIAT